jgi:hypothetical protein
MEARKQMEDNPKVWALVTTDWLWSQGHFILCNPTLGYGWIRQNLTLTSGGTNSWDAWAANCKILVTSET